MLKAPYKPNKGTRVPRLDLIPRAALLSLAARFEKGIESFGADAWNASLDKEALERGASDKEFVEARLNHVLDHATKALAKLRGQMPEDGDDDAGAILFAGALLAVHRSIK